MNLIRLRVLFKFGVEPVLYRVVRPSRQQLRYFTPSVALFGMHRQYDAVFFSSPLLLLDVWVQMVVPSFPALLANASWQLGSNATPILGAFANDHPAKDVIFFLSPGPFRDEGYVFQLEPPIEALNLRPTAHAFTYLVPPLVPELVYKAQQLRILYLI